MQHTATQEPTDMDALMNKDYDNINDPSLLRFLVDVRGADATAKQVFFHIDIYEERSKKETYWYKKRPIQRHCKINEPSLLRFLVDVRGADVIATQVSCHINIRKEIWKRETYWYKERRIQGLRQHQRPFAPALSRGCARRRCVCETGLFAQRYMKRDLKKRPPDTKRDLFKDTATSTTLRFLVDVRDADASATQVSLHINIWKETCKRDVLKWNESNQKRGCARCCKRDLLTWKETCKRDLLTCKKKNLWKRLTDMKRDLWKRLTYMAMDFLRRNVCVQWWDDLISLLIAGHETTGSMLTWKETYKRDVLTWKETCERDLLKWE